MDAERWMAEQAAAKLTEAAATQEKRIRDEESAAQAEGLRDEEGAWQRKFEEDAAAWAEKLRDEEVAWQRKSDEEAAAQTEGFKKEKAQFEKDAGQSLLPTGAPLRGDWPSRQTSWKTYIRNSIINALYSIALRLENPPNPRLTPRRPPNHPPRIPLPASKASNCSRKSRRRRFHRGTVRLNKLLRQRLNLVRAL
jgi:hypothetical protein